ncbi:helix-turn-helix domain-containing protein [Planococcus maritimus]|nr:helix-turn-helix domain-containing protein [Planococcus sp. SK3692]MDE4086201.1 helix-turn-helix domain-containing protein [Planococcus maritimus]
MQINAINFEELRKHESFKSIVKMDESIYTHIDHIRHDVAKSVIDVLLCLGRSSLRCVGLSFMKQATIAKNTGYSRKTVNKALKTLEAYGVIDSVRTKTKKGRPSVKIVRILPFCLEKLQQAVTAIEAAHAYGDNGLNMIEKFEPFKSESPKTLKEDKNAVTDIPFDQLDDSFVPKTIVANEFIQIAKPFFNAATIFKLWGNVKSVMKQSQLDFVSYDVMESVKEAFKSTVFMYKANRIKTTFDRYFVGALTNELVEVKRREIRDSIPNDSIFSYDWLNA